MKKTGNVFILVAAAFCCVLLFASGCKGGNKGGGIGGSFVREDMEGLVCIDIVNGRGEMTLDLDKWDSVYKIFQGSNKNDYIKGPFKIITQHDSAIVDAYAGRIRDLSFYEGPAPLLYAVLLMENGTIERVEVYPYRTAGDDLYTSGPLPWLSGIVSISSEGGTVYAKDESGKKYDIYIPLALPNIGKEDWLIKLDSLENLEYFGSMHFSSENTVSYRIWNEAGNWMEYYGYYEMILHEGHLDGWAPNTIQLFLSLDSYNDLDPIMWSMPKDIEATLSIDIDPRLYTITLRHLSGTHLYGNGGVYQEVFTMEQMFGSDLTIYPYEMIDFLKGRWEFFLPGYNQGCTFDIYYSNFDRYTLDFTFTLTDKENGFEVSQLKGGLSSGMENAYGEDINTLTLYLQGIGRQNETYSLKDMGIHKGKRMIRLAPNDGGVQSVFDQLELQERYGYAHVPLVFGKAANEQHKGSTITNESWNAVFWEYDQKNNTVWLTRAGLNGDDPACVSAEYKVNDIEDWKILEALPGMDCWVRTNAKGEVVEFILPMG